MPFNQHNSRLAARLACAALLLLAPLAAWAGAASDPYVALLKEWSHRDATAASNFRSLLGDREVIKELFARNDQGQHTEAEVMDRLLVRVASEDWTVINEAREADAGDLLHDFDHQLAGFGHELTEEQRRDIASTAKGRERDRRGELMGRMYGPLAAAAEHFGLKILNLHDGTDDYKLAVVSPATYDRWLGFVFSPGLRVEDGSAPFAAQLDGTPYARFVPGAEWSGDAQTAH